jgi:hypothetical protein
MDFIAVGRPTAGRAGVSIAVLAVLLHYTAFATNEEGFAAGKVFRAAKPV